MKPIVFVLDRICDQWGKECSRIALARPLFSKRVLSLVCNSQKHASVDAKSSFISMHVALKVLYRLLVHESKSISLNSGTCVKILDAVFGFLQQTSAGDADAGVDVINLAVLYTLLSLACCWDSASSHVIDKGYLRYIANSDRTTLWMLWQLFRGTLLSTASERALTALSIRKRVEVLLREKRDDYTHASTARAMPAPSSRGHCPALSPVLLGK